MKTIISPIAARLAVCAAVALQASVRADDYIRLFPVSVETSIAPPSVTFSWEPYVDEVTFEIYRRTGFGPQNATGFVLLDTLTHEATGWTDTAVEVGQAYDYRIIRRRSGYTLEQKSCITVAIDAPTEETWGKIILAVEESAASELAGRLARLEQDLTGAGWSVIRLEYPRNDDANRLALQEGLRAEIRAIYDANPSEVEALLLFGNLPIPLTGWNNLDGHYDRVSGTNSFYADVDGEWTDVEFFQDGQPRDHTNNIPGDGKYDQRIPPSPEELMAGRVDLSGMSYYEDLLGKTEMDLLRNYLRKNHLFRNKIIPTPTLGSHSAFSEKLSAFSVTTLYAMMGPENIWRGEMSRTPENLLFNGGYCDDYEGYFSDDETYTEFRTVFGEGYKSYQFDWNLPNNTLRGYLAMPDYTLTSVFRYNDSYTYSDPDHYAMMHYPMAAGKPIGWCMRELQNSNIMRTELHCYGVAYGLLGDPTLRMHIVQPAEDVTVQPQAGGYRLAWSAPQPDPMNEVLGYFVYRAVGDRLGPYEKISGEAPVTDLFFADTPPTGQNVYYMVRPIARTYSATGTYFNVGQGSFARVNADGSVNRPPAPDDFQVSLEMNERQEISLLTSDPDGDPLIYDVAVPPQHGTLSGDAPDLIYTPKKGFTGNDSFTYTVWDGTTRREAEVQLEVLWKSWGLFRFETETLDDAHAKPTATSYGTHASAKYTCELKSDAVGQDIVYTIDVPVEGTYSIGLGYFPGKLNGHIQLLVDGQPQGPIVDQYAAQTPPLPETVDLGTLQLSQGPHAFQLTVVDKNPSSSNYRISADFFELVPLDTVADVTCLEMSQEEGETARFKFRYESRAHRSLNFFHSTDLMNWTPVTPVETLPVEYEAKEDAVFLLDLLDHDPRAFLRASASPEN